MKNKLDSQKLSHVSGKKKYKKNITFFLTVGSELHVLAIHAKLRDMTNLIALLIALRSMQFNGNNFCFKEENNFRISVSAAQYTA